jgi:hypothetical protein
MQSNYIGKLQASTSSAAKIYIDMDIPEVKKYHDRYYPTNYNLRLSTSILNTNKKLFCTAFKGDIPKLQQQQPKVVQLTPIEAAGQLYKIDQISQMPMSSFQVTRKQNSIHITKSCF